MDRSVLTYRGNVLTRDSNVRTADVLRSLHTGPRMLVLPNAWDAASARLFAEAAFPAIATTSAGIAYALGYPDGERVTRAQMLEVVARIAAAVPVPVTADMEAGYGRPPEAAAETARGVVAAGAAGMNLEDWSGELLDSGLAVERVRAAREAADETGVRLVINARTDAYRASGIPPGRRFDEAVRRGTAYLAAGADCVFVPHVGDFGTIERLVTAIPGPVNILGGPNAPSLTELEHLGVRRVTFGSAPMRATLGLVRRIANELRDRGTYGTLQAYAIPFAEMQELYGSRE